LWRAHLFIMSGVYEEQPYGVDFCSVFQVCVSNPSYDTSSDSFYYIYHVCLCGAIFCPLFLLFTAIYARIGHFLWVRRVVGGGSGAKQQIKRKKRIALALLGLVVSFFVCRMPNWIFVILAMSQLIEEMTPTIYMMKVTFVFLSVLNTSLNPMLYVLVDEPMSKTLSSCSSTLFDGFCLCCQSPDSPNQVSFNGDNQSPSQLMITKSTKFETTEDGGTDGPSPSVLAIIEEINKATANSKPAETH
jgi:7 transmembrane receptor (rhodopsin family)